MYGCNVAISALGEKATPKATGKEFSLDSAVQLKRDSPTLQIDDAVEQPIFVIEEYKMR